MIGKTWVLLVDQYAPADYHWITGLGCTVEIIYSIYGETVSINGVDISVPSNEVRITTTCSKQDYMLKLKYEDKLILKNL